MRAERSAPARRVAVLGSLNVDLVTRVPRFAQPGETLSARSFAMYPGGKGANQAVACGRLGASVAMYGALGDDPLAGRLRASLAEAGVDTAAVATIADVATGTADIWVDDAGENIIAIAAGANGLVDGGYVDRHLASLNAAAYLLLQLEVPLATLRHLLERLPAEGGPRVVLDPAPAQALDELPLERLWLITPNEHELAALTGLPTGDDAEVEAAARALRRHTGVPRLVAKAGARGAFLLEGERFERVAGFPVDAVDTTAAGDAFNGALAASLVGAPGRDPDLRAATRRANAAAALAVTRPGAQPAMADGAELDRFLRQHRGRPEGRPRG